MIETAVVFDKEGHLIHWHEPHGRTGGSLPDSRSLWDVLWENRENLGGVAHTHPWKGSPDPSSTDLSTFAAVEASLGQRLVWPIVTMSHTATFIWQNDRYVKHLGCPIDKQLIKDLRLRSEVSNNG